MNQSETNQLMNERMSANTQGLSQGSNLFYYLETRKKKVNQVIAWACLRASNPRLQNNKPQ